MWSRAAWALLLRNTGFLLATAHPDCEGVLTPSVTHRILRYSLPMSDSVNGTECCWILRAPSSETVEVEILSYRTGSGTDSRCSSTHLAIQLGVAQQERRFCGLFWSIPEADPKLVIRGKGPVIVTLRAAASRAEQGFTLRYSEGTTVKIPTYLVLDMTFTLRLGDPTSEEYQNLAEDFTYKVCPFYKKVPGFQQLLVEHFSAGSVLIKFNAVFNAREIRAYLLDPDSIFSITGLRAEIAGGLEIGGAQVVRVYVTDDVVGLCGEVFSCQPGFQCVHSETGNVSCTSLCHTDYCKNNGICTHSRGQEPMCQCPVGSDYWFMGSRCDHRMTRQSLIAIAFGVVFSLAVVMAAVAIAVLRRFKVLLIEAKVEQTRSSYRRFSRFDDFSPQYQSQSWLNYSISSLDNPGFSNSDELIHLQMLDSSYYSCHGESVTGTFSSRRTAPHGRSVFRHSLQNNLDISINSINEHAGDSGKASDLSVCSWPVEPLPWSPFPILYQLNSDRPSQEASLIL
uniref:interphotoreceptor matrix proteoglycan 2 n=1 Tax=Pristiophorus japonicus TaxID=55135 RepID=UPI00398F500F